MSDVIISIRRNGDKKERKYVNADEVINLNKNKDKNKYETQPDIRTEELVKRYKALMLSKDEEKNEVSKKKSNVKSEELVKRYNSLISNKKDEKI